MGFHWLGAQFLCQGCSQDVACFLAECSVLFVVWLYGGTHRWVTNAGGLCADLLEVAGVGSDAELDGDDGDESSDDQDDSQGAGPAVDLAALDYDAMLAAGAAAQQAHAGDESADDSLGAAGSSEDNLEDVGRDGELDSEGEQPQQAQQGRDAKRAQRGRAAVEDDFLRLDELEAFLDQAEAEEAGGGDGEGEE